MPLPFSSLCTTTKEEEVTDFKEKLAQEAQWIFYRLQDANILQNVEIGEEKAYVDKVQNVLNLIKKELLDIPFIALNKKIEYIPQLNEACIWRIAALSIDYGKFVHQRQQIVTFLNKIKDIYPAY